MATAWEMLAELGIEVPVYRPDPENRDKARDDYRKALQAMQVQYREKTRDLRYPPDPGRRPEQYEGAPEFPHATQYPPEPQRPQPPIGLTLYPSNVEIGEYIAKGGPVSDKLPELATSELRALAVLRWQGAMQQYEDTLVEYRPKWQAAHEAEQAELRAYSVRNEEWLDTVFYPGEAERALWEAANEVLEESKRRIRAEADLAQDELTILQAKRERALMEREAAAEKAASVSTADANPETK